MIPKREITKIIKLFKLYNNTCKKKKFYIEHYTCILHNKNINNQLTISFTIKKVTRLRSIIILLSFSYSFFFYYKFLVMLQKFGQNKKINKSYHITIRQNFNTHVLSALLKKAHLKKFFFLLLMSITIY